MALVRFRLKLVQNFICYCNDSITADNVRYFVSGTHYFRQHKTSSKQWLIRQNKDLYVKQAERDNYKCRSAYKLIQIDDKYRFLHPGMIVIDCGAAPGSWCQVAVERTNACGADAASPKGVVIGVDLQPMSCVAGAHIIPSMDFTHDGAQARIRELLNGQKADVILSDMAPKATGVKSHNHEYIIGLCFSVLRFSLKVLKPSGTLLCKLWMGSEQERLERAMKHVFEQIHMVKPESSRADSAEVFYLATGFRGVTPT